MDRKEGDGGDLYHNKKDITIKTGSLNTGGGGQKIQTKDHDRKG